MKYPTFWDGFLYFFGLADNPHKASLEEYANRKKPMKIEILSDEEAMRRDQEQLKGDWERVGSYLEAAVNKVINKNK